MGLLSLVVAVLLGAPAAPAGSSPPPPSDVAPQISQWWSYEGQTWVKSGDDEVRVEAPQDRVYWYYQVNPRTTTKSEGGMDSSIG